MSANPYGVGQMGDVVIDPMPSGPTCDCYDKTAVHVVLGVMVLGVLGLSVAAATGAIAVGQAKPSYARRQSEAFDDRTVPA